MFKFERLEIYQSALDYVDRCYTVAEGLPESERYNLRSQLLRAATSVVLNIAEGSTGQSDAEQVRFLGMALRSLLETVACGHLIQRRGYLKDASALTDMLDKAQTLARRIQSMRRALGTTKGRVGEEFAEYGTDWEMTTDDGR